MAPEFKCSKCSSEMQAGLVVDLNYAGIIRSMWVDEQAGNGASPETVMSGKRKVKTTTYRCSNCGYLDSYAK